MDKLQLQLKYLKKKRGLLLSICYDRWVSNCKAKECSMCWIYTAEWHCTASALKSETELRFPSAGTPWHLPQRSPCCCVALISFCLPLIYSAGQHQVSQRSILINNILAQNPVRTVSDSYFRPRGPKDQSTSLLHFLPAAWAPWFTVQLFQ